MRRPRLFLGGVAGRLRRRRRTGRAGAATHKTRRFFLVRLQHRGAGVDGGRGRGGRGGNGRGLRLRGLVVAEALLGLLLGLALGFLVVAAALFLVALARFRRLALDPLGRFALVAAARLFLGDLALFRLAHLGVGERMRPGAALLLGQRAQDDSGRP